MDDYELNSKPLNRGSSLFKSDPYTRLLSALRNREPRTFRRILENEDLDPNHYYDYGEYKTILEIACSDPGLSEFVKILLDNDADVNKVNETHKKSPIHFAVETGDINTVQTLIDDPNIKIDILSKGNTALHLAIKQIKESGDDNELYVEKYQKIIKSLLEKGSNVNIPDLKNITPIYSAASQRLKSIVELIITHSKEDIDLDSYKDRRGKTARKLIEETYPQLLEKISIAGKPTKVDINKLFSHLSGHNEDAFIKDLQRVKDKDEIEKMITENNGLYTLLQFACNNGMDLAAKALLELGADPNASAPGNNMKPVALACCGGFHKILSLLIANDATSFDAINGDSLLQLAIKEEKESIDDPNVDYKECKRLLISNKTINPNINFVDVKRNTALHYAAKSGDQATVLELLNNGAYVGIRNKFNDPPLADMSPKTFEEFLDGCLTTNSVRPNDENYELQFDYSFLVPPDCVMAKEASKVPLMNDSTVSNQISKNLMPETDVLLYMTQHPDLKNLLKHPVITSFLYMKWQRISCLFYANITFYSLFWLSLILYILLGYQDEKTETTENLIQLTRVLTIIGVFLISIREFMQIIVSPKRYLQSIENWLEIALIIVTIVILSDESASKRQQFCAVAILLSSAELVLLVGQFPSLSTNIVMLKTVSWNFFKFLLWYCILIIAFALSFYTLFRTGENKDDDSKPYDPNKPSGSDDEETNFFLDPGMSLFKTIVMLTGEFDAGSINFSSFPITSHIIFIIFVFMIPIVLFNLLNGLAVSDTQAIKSDAELVSQISRIQLISYFESVLLGDMQPYQNLLSNAQNGCCWLPGHACIKPRFICIRPLAKRICLFPDYLPTAKINVKVNQSGRVEICPTERMKKNGDDDHVMESGSCCLCPCSDLFMDRQIVKAAKNVIIAKQAEISDIQQIKIQLASMEKMIEQMFNSINKK